MKKIKEDGILTSELLFRIQEALFRKEEWYKEIKRNKADVKKY